MVTGVSAFHLSKLFKFSFPDQCEMKNPTVLILYIPSRL